MCVFSVEEGGPAKADGLATASDTPPPDRRTWRRAAVARLRPKKSGGSRGRRRCILRSLAGPEGRPPVSASARLEARIDLVDDVDPALAAHDSASLMPGLDGLQRRADLHGPDSKQKPRRGPGKSEAARNIRMAPCPVNPAGGTSNYEPPLAPV